jgi:hypothetical protein
MSRFLWVVNGFPRRGDDQAPETDDVNAFLGLIEQSGRSGRSRTGRHDAAELTGVLFGSAGQLVSFGR